MRTLSIGCVAIGLAAVVGVAPASLAQNPGVLDRCKSAGAGIEAEERRTDPGPGSNTGVFVALPIGRVCVGPESVDGEASYVRRIKAGEGMAIVEVSTTPFMPDLPATKAAAVAISRPDQPAGW